MYDLVDAHHHLWNPISADPDVGYVWLRKIGAPKPFGDPTAIQRDYLLDEFLGEERPLPLTASVHVQADGAIADPVAETVFIQDLAEAGNFPIAIVGFVDLAREDAAQVIERHGRHRRFCGVRQIFSRLADKPALSFAEIDYLQDAGWRDRFALLADYRLSFDLQCYPEQMAEAAAFFAQHPDIPVVIDHAGSPWDASASGLARWREGVALLAELSHVSIKLCGFGMFDRQWNAASVQPLFAHLEEFFGPQRMLFGSNYPVDKLMRPYDAIVGDMQTLTAHWSSDDKILFFSGNAREIYRF